jgi:dTDP-4-amino-4,6-dideoxygalactose transaminase
MGDFAAQYRDLKDEMDAAYHKVMESGGFVLGSSVARLEEEVAALSGVAHGIGVNSGTDALLISMVALGFGPGDEVITTPFTFFATAETISLTGATPVFVDIDPATFNIDPAAVEAAVTPRTKGIVPVHLYGQMADMDPLMTIAEKHGLAVVEDAAQVIGGSYKGRPAGSIGHMAGFSFYPSKNLGACGDAGMIVTNDDGLAARARVLRAHGSSTTYHYERLGYCSRLDELQAAFLRVKLPHLKAWNDARRAHAAIYDERLAGSGVTLPVAQPENHHVYHQYTVRGPRRDDLKRHLAERGVDANIYYPLALHQQEVYKDLGYKPGSLPHSEAAAAEVLSLPVHQNLSPEDVIYAAARIREFTD